MEESLRSVPLFELLAASQLPDIARLLRPVVLKTGQVLFRQGQGGHALWVLGPGTEILLSAWSDVAGGPVVVAHVREGTTIGEMSLIDGGPRSATATVAKGGPAQRIDAADFSALREAHHPAAFQVMRKICLDLCAKLRATADRIATPDERPVLGPVLQPVPLPSPEMLDDFGPFAGLPRVVKLAMTQKLGLVETSSEELVFCEGERGDATYFVIGGEVRVERGDRRLATLGPGKMFGLVGLVDGGNRIVTCRTAGPARLLRLGAAEFDALFAGGNRFAQNMVTLVARQLADHLRIANALLPRLDGEPSPPAPGAEGEESSPGEDLLPLDQELELILNADQGS